MASSASQGQTSPLLCLPAEIRTRIWSLISEDYRFQFHADTIDNRVMRECSTLRSILRSCQLIHNEAAPFLTVSVTIDGYSDYDIWWPDAAQCSETSSGRIIAYYYLWTTIIPMIRSITITEVDLGDNGPVKLGLAPVLLQAKSLELLVVGNLGLYGIQPCHEVDSKEELYDFFHGRYSQQTSLEIQVRKTMDSFGYDHATYDEDAEDEDQIRYYGDGWKWLLDLMNRDTLPFRLCVLSIMRVGPVYYGKKSGKKFFDHASSAHVVSVLLR